MSFKYKLKTNPSQIKKVHAEFERRVKAAILSELEYVGWQFVKMAREKESYNDITGNLRSSIGFIIVNHGQIVDENFLIYKKGREGTKEGRRLTKEIATKHPNGYALIVVAGMEYAAAVEHKGKDVITGSSLIAEGMLKDAFANLKKKSLF